MVLPTLGDSLWNALSLGETPPDQTKASGGRPQQWASKLGGTKERGGIPSQLRADTELFPSKAGAQV